MILRKFVKHVTEQNWFAVGLDVIVVIVGIFLGFQVQEWVNDREKKVQELVFINRLHEDVMGAVGFKQELNQKIPIEKNQKDYQRNLNEVIDVLGGFDSSISLGPEHCASIMFSHTYSSPNTSLATLTELISSGQLSSITNDDIKVELLEYLQAEEALAVLVDSLNSQNVIMYRKYPQLMKWDISAGSELFLEKRQHKCDFENMANNVSFINDLADNKAKRSGKDVRYSIQQEKLENMHAILDRELGIAH